MQLSRRVLSVSPSKTLAIAAKAKELKAQGVDVISLGAGEPDFDTPDFIKQAAIQALQSGVTKYTPAEGTLELRKSICAKFERDQKLKFKPNQIIVSSGAKHSIFNSLFILVNDGDEVLIPAPYWLSYPEMVSMVGGKSVRIPTDEKTCFKVTPALLKKYISKKTKMFILNSPSNPTGAVYDRGELEALIAVLKEYPDCVILSDEIYEKLIYDGKKHVSIAQLDPGIAARTILVNGHSKAYSMTGWRLGYAAYPTGAMAEAAGSMQSHSTSNPVSFAQPGGVVALDKGDADAARMCAAFEKRRNDFYSALCGIPKLEPFKPQGAFYMFVGIVKTGMDSLVFTEKLLAEGHVAVVPGQPFGADHHIRMSFAASEKNLEEAVRRIAAWLK
ncbi:MAG: pyridoxal phosphate-dependent aminotransferase [Candidatus Omnitrophota bacterium]